MARSNRQRKRDRAIRQAKSARKQSRGAAPERLVQIAEALRAAEHDAGRDESLTYLLFAAGAAHAAGDGGQARRLLDEALRILDGLHDDDDEPQIWIRIMGHLRLLGRGADALELTEDRLRRDPEDQAAAGQYAIGISDAFKRVAAEGSAAHPAEQAALDRFADRSNLAELQDAIAAYVPRSRYREPIGDSVAGWLSIARDWDPHERAALGILVQEQAQVVATVSPDDTVAGSPGDDDDSTGLLRDFAAHSDVPVALRERARVWREHIHYGLWQVAEPDPAPGVECVDITTGVIRYVEFPAEMIERLPRWGVLFGPVVPVDGIWRSTGNAVQLSPSEADAMAETLMDALEGLVQDLSGESSKRAFRRARQPIPFGHAGPHDVLAYHGDGPGPQTIQLMNYVACSLLPRLTADLHDYRTTPPAMLNSDGDPMKVINARIAVRDAATLAGRLADHADFRRDEDDPAKLVWLGKLIPEDQRAVMLANLNPGIDTDDPGIPGRPDDDGPQRWVRGQLEIAGRELTVEVNSENRLARLLEVLTKLGESPSVIDETQVDPAQDLAWPAGPVTIPRGAAPAGEGWEKHWLDGPVPVLHGRTPRETAESGDWPMLEAMLRQFEYEADILAASGQAGVDTAYLRAELNLPADPWEINRSRAHLRPGRPG